MMVLSRMVSTTDTISDSTSGHHRNRILLFSPERLVQTIMGQGFPGGVE